MKVKKIQLLFLMVCCCFLLSVFTGSGYVIFDHEAEMMALLSVIMLLDAFCNKRIFNFEWKKLEVILYLLQILLMAWQVCFHSQYPNKTMIFLIRHITMLPMIVVAIDEKYAYKLIKLSEYYVFIIDIVYLVMWPFRGNNGSFINSYQYVAAYSSILVTIILAKMFTMSAFSRKDICLLMIALLVLIMTGKRSYLIVLMIVFLSGILFIRGKKKIQRLIRIMVPILIAGGTILMFNPKILSAFARFSELNADSTLSGRTKLWTLAEYLWKLDFWTGIGYGSFSSFTTDHMAYVYSNFGVQRTYAAHNIYLQLLAETGIVGFCLFCAFFIAALIGSIKLLKQIEKSEFELRYLATVALFLQMWFLMYGMSGNPLYMPGQFGMYLFGVLIIRSVARTKHKIECEKMYE